MSLFDLVAAIIIGLVGLGLLVWLLKIVLGSVAPYFSKHGSVNPKLMHEKWQIKRRLALLRDIDRVLAAEDFEGAAKRLRDLFVLDLVRGNAGLLESIRSHNFMCLSKIIVVAQKTKTVLPTISALETLLEERARLMTLYNDSSTLRDRIRAKRRKDGKGEWDDGEFSKKIAEVSQDIDRNREYLKRELDATVNQLIRQSSGGDIKFH